MQQSHTEIDLGVDDNWLRLKCNICYDNLNVADFIREYVTGDLYKLLLHDRAPVIELVTNNNLPRKRFANGNDLFKECIEQEKNQEQLHLRSKFLDKFATLMSLKEKGKNYQDAKGFEKILAAQILLGESDITQPENFGVIEKEYENAKGKKVTEKLWAKIDHGRSLCYCANDWIKVLLEDFNASYGIEVDYKRVALELSAYVKTISESTELIDRLIDKKASNLNQLLNSEMKFTLRYNSSNGRVKEEFSYSSEFKEFMSHKVNSLGNYFKQRLENQIQAVRKFSEKLAVISAIDNNFAAIKNLFEEFSNFQYENPLIWAIETGKKLDGKDPIIWAVETDKKLDDKDPIIWAIDNGENIEGKKPGKCAAEHNLLINGKNPEIFVSKVQSVKFVNNTSLPIAGLAIAACVGFIIANLSMALIISVVAVALVAALIIKPIASYIQKDLLQNSTVSTSLNDPNVGGFQRESQLC
ncbi:UNVERIFIED_CONTAM: hypothetical protein LBW93_03440 [Wolbachia endosymbiont of Nasonia longicornis]